MPVVQVEMHVLADRPTERMTSSTSCPALPTACWTSAARSASRPSCGLRLRGSGQDGCAERGRRLPDAEVADIDAATDSFSVAQPLRHLDEPPGLQARGVLEKDEGATGRWRSRALSSRIALSRRSVCCPISCWSWTTRPAMRPAKRSANSPTTARPGSVSTLMPRLRWTMGRTGAGARTAERARAPPACRHIARRPAHLGEAQPSQLEQRIVPPKRRWNRP